MAKHGFNDSADAFRTEHNEHGLVIAFEQQNVATENDI